MTAKPSSRTQRDFSFGGLYDFLFARFPDHRSKQQVLDVPRLATDLEMSAEGVYRILRKNKLNADQAKKIIEISEGRITIEDTVPFVYA